MLRRNVLIFHQAALGDFVLTWPLAVALARIYAQSRIIYVTAREKGLLAERVLRLESADAEGGWHGLFADGGDLPDRAAKLLAGAHAVYTFGRVTPAWVANVRRLSPPVEPVVIDLSPPAAVAHATDVLLGQLAGRPPELEATRQILRSVADRGIGYAHGGGGVVIHPGAGSPDKCWPADRFADLAARLAAAGHRVRFVVGEVERDRWPADAMARLNAAAEVRHPATLVDLLAEVAAADLFVGNDSGPGHLAGILGVPTVTLFGPTDPARWRPWGPAARVVRRQPLSDLPVADVLDAARPEVGRV